MKELSSPIQYLKGVGEKRALLFKKLGIETISGIINHFPRSYINCTSPVEIENAIVDEYNVISGIVTAKSRPIFTKNKVSIFKGNFSDYTSDITIVIFNSEFLFKQLEIGRGYILYGKVTKVGGELQITSPMIIPAGQEVKIIPQYPLTEGLSQKIVSSCVKNALEEINAFPFEILPKNILSELELCSLQFAWSKIHFPDNDRDIELARKRLIFDELLVLSLGMSMLKQKRRTFTGNIMAENIEISEFYDSLPFTLTNSQLSAIEDCISDMKKNVPMSRLIQGDVGSGKTAVAAASCYLTAKNGFQSALMAPTEILANQHYKTLTDFLAPLGVKTALLTGSTSAKDKKLIKEQIEKGEIQVVIGTHALIQKTTVFKNLALVITDEQHRFGVNQRDTLTKKGEFPHVLIMSATPIPRTLALMIYGDLDVSVLKELPKGRIPIKTYAVTGKLRERAYNYIKDEIKKGRQIYIVCPAIEENEVDMIAVKSYYEEFILPNFSEFRTALLHGKMSASDKENIMESFKNGEVDLLVSTTVIEVGVDVPNATIIMIENSDRFGLSQLHQLRGRVGRGIYESHCILVTDNVTEDSIKRLKILSSTNDGFKISEEDLALRGPGDFFGSKQHGLPKLKIADLTTDMEIMTLAMETAKKILAHDPGLLSLENKEISNAVIQLFRNNLI